MRKLNSFSGLGLLFLLLYLIVFLFPEPLWGINSFYFLPEGIRWAVGIGAILLWLFGEEVLTFIREIAQKLPDGIVKTQGLLLALPAAIFVLSYLFPIYQDSFGDAFFIAQAANVVTEQWDPLIIKRILTFNILEPKIGTDTYYGLTNLLSYFLGWNGKEAIVLFNALCGSAFVLLWMLLVRKNISDASMRMLLYLVGAFAPFTQVFYGHYEIYAPVYVCLMGYFLALTNYFRTCSKRSLLLSAFWLVLAVKFHITSLLLLPSLLLALLYSFPRYQSLFTWKNILIGLGIPILLGGIGIYVFVTHSVNGPRMFGEDNLTDAVFLPVKALEGPPLDRYNLFSLAHWGDYLNLTFVWSGAAVFLLLTVIAFFRRQIKWTRPGLLVTGLTCLLYAGAFFILNPLLSMPADWDLFSLPAAPMLVLLALFMADSQEPFPRFAGPAMALCLLGYSYILAHSLPASLSARLESLGRHNFKTYWKGSSGFLIQGIDLEQNDSIAALRLDKVLHDLEPWTTPGLDNEYANLLWKKGEHFYKKQNYPQALPFFERAYGYSPHLAKNVFSLFVTRFVLKDYAGALELSTRLIDYAYPSREKALRMAIHAAIEAGDREAALTYCREQLQYFSEDLFIKNLLTRLEQGESMKNLKGLFRKE